MSYDAGYCGYYGHFCPQTQAQSNIIKHGTILSPFSIQTDVYCLFMDTAGSLHLSHSVPYMGSDSRPYLIDLPPCSL